MKIAICGSMQFSKEMLGIKQKLEDLGHKVIVPEGTDDYVSGKRRPENKWEKLELNVIKEYYKEIKNSDAVLIVNISKNGIENYIGGNALIEMAFAHILDKKIFLLNPIPNMSYKDEIEAMKSIVLNNDLRKIV